METCRLSDDGVLNALQAPTNLVVLNLGLIQGPFSVEGADITSPDWAGQPPAAALFPALRTLQFRVSEIYPLGRLLSALPLAAPNLERLVSWDSEWRRDETAPFSEALSVAQVLQFSHWGRMKLLNLPNCSVGIFGLAVKMSPVPVFLPQLLSLHICFIQDVGVMKPVLENIPIMFPKLQTLGLYHDGSRLFSVFNSLSDEPLAYEDLTAQYDFFVESFGIFNLISSFSMRHPSIKVEFKAAPDSSFLIY